MAGVEGIEPSSSVLETEILPLDHTPKKLLFHCFMNRMFFAPFAKFFQV